MDPQLGDRPSRGTRLSRWGIFITTLLMGAALLVTGLTGWSEQREAAGAVAEARAFDLFRAVRRSLRDEGPPPDTRGGGALFDLAGLLSDFEDAGLRYVALVTLHGQVLGSAGAARGAISPGFERHPPGEPEVERVADRVRLDGTLGRRPGRAVRLLLEVEPVLAARLEASAVRHLVVSAVAAALLMLVAIFFWRMASRADRAEAALTRQRRLAALGEMSAVLGHELRNPLAALKGHAQLVVERTEPEAKSRKNAERVVLEAERLEALTSQILDFAKTGAVHTELADPAAMLTGVAQRHKDARLRVAIEGAPASWTLDRARMEQVLDNVVKNALQASPAEAPIDVACALRGDRLVFTVRDRGPGFPPGEEAAAFEPFRTHRVQGTGLGLAIARRIVEAHGGSIGAINADGGGALVEVSLPLRSPEGS